jgi:hypothetical protein
VHGRSEPNAGALEEKEFAMRLGNLNYGATVIVTAQFVADMSKHEAVTIRNALSYAAGTSQFHGEPSPLAQAAARILPIFDRTLGYTSDES